jgi:hypothetical protein
MAEFICPVCGYSGLIEPPYSNQEPSFEICPSCGTEFGLDDDDRSFDQLRDAWIASGSKWWSSHQAPPQGWDSAKQLSKLKA